MGSVVSRTEDRTVYPEEERLGEDIVQRWIVELLRPLIERWLLQRGDESFVGADQFIYFEQFNPGRVVAPDVYVLPGVARETPVSSWKVWETGIVPSFALEVVSSNWEKDYRDAPRSHEILGTRELLIFDPKFDERRDGRRWQRYVRAAERLDLVEHGNGPVVFSEVLGAWLRAVGEGSSLRLRLTESQDSLSLFPTAEEAERQAKEAALARVAELEALLRERRRE
jgi:Putative restriction endonuclease